jgi:hypothetical protein
MEKPEVRVIDLSKGQWRLVRALEKWLDKKQISPGAGDLAKTLHVSNSTVYAHLRALEGLGVVSNVGFGQWARTDEGIRRSPEIKGKGVPTHRMGEALSAFVELSEWYGKSPTYAEIGQHMGITRVRASQLVGLAIRTGYLRVVRTDKQLPNAIPEN